MSSTHEVDPVRRIVIVTLDGDLTDEKLFMLYDRLQDDPEVKPDFALLIDLRRASGFKVTSTGVHALAQRPLMLSPEARRAVVVPSDFGVEMARVYNRMREAGGGGTAIFRDLDEAKRWAQSKEE